MVKTNIDNTVKSRKNILMNTDASGKIFAADSYMDPKD
jgi:hypothetical protein